LDAEGNSTEAEINEALEKASLGEFNARSMTSNLSTGQIQLLSLASAFLNKKSRLLLLDEPTSQIDSATQKRVLKNLFSAHRDSTVIMIAHRLETAVDYADRVLVLDQGRLVEFDHPFKLLAQNIQDDSITNNGIFAQMVRALNKNQQDKVFRKAKKRYIK
jgi:ABC-type multidrug transport system fused ATPase/permease subunit